MDICNSNDVAIVLKSVSLKGILGDFTIDQLICLNINTTCTALVDWI